MNWMNGGNGNNRVFIKRIGVVLIMLMTVMFLGGWGLFSKKIPEATGKDASTLKTELENLKKDLVIQYDYEFNENVSKGLVSRTEPASGTKVEKGATVTIFISKGKPITISDYTNTNIETVKGILASQGLNFDCTTSYSEDIKADNVISIDPGVGTVVEEGTMVNLVVSLGSEFREIPDYSEMTGTELANVLENLGAKYSETDDFTTEVAAGYVMTCN